MYINVLIATTFFFERIKSLFSSKDSLKHFAFVLLVYVFGYLALIRANVYYMDDLARTIGAHMSWSFFSRYSSDFLSQWVNMISSETMTVLDIAPLSQIIAMAVLAVVSLMILKIFNIKVAYSYLFATAIIGLSPFYLENMSYRMDAPYMAIAIFASVFPFLFLRNNAVFFVVGILSLLLMFTTYQAANSVFILMTVFLVLDMLINAQNIKVFFKEACVFVAKSVFVIFSATLIYKGFILNEVDGYAASHMLSDVSQLQRNFHLYFTLLHTNFNQTILGKLSIFAIVLFPVVVYFAQTANSKQQTANSKQQTANSSLITLISVLLLIVAILISNGLYMALEKPLFDARALNGVGVFFAFLFVLILKYSYHIARKLSQCLLALFLYNLFVISYAYGNGLAAQNAFNEFRANALIYELNKPEFKNIRRYAIYFSNGKLIAPRTQMARNEFPVLNMLIQEGNQGNRDLTGGFNYWGKVRYRIWRNSCVTKDSVVVKKIETDLHNITIYNNDCMVVHYN